MTAVPESPTYAPSPAQVETESLDPTSLTNTTPSPTMSMTGAPTTPITGTPSVTVTLSALPLPYIALMDDGGSDWVATGNWHLDTIANSDPDVPGLGWMAVAGEDQSVLQLTLPIDLRTALNPTLTFSTILTDSEADAVVEIGLDGQDWTTVAQLRASSTWSNVIVDLRSFCGLDVWLRFRLAATPQSDPVQSLATWLIDDVVVIDLGPPSASPSPEITPTSDSTSLPPSSGEQPLSCRADVDADGLLTAVDLITIGSSAVYDTTVEMEGWDASLDFNVDGQVDILDLQIAAQVIGVGCVPDA